MLFRSEGPASNFSFQRYECPVGSYNPQQFGWDDQDPGDGAPPCTSDDDSCCFNPDFVSNCTSFCKRCPAGYTCPNNATITPFPCAYGNYCPIGSASPGPCPSGRSCPTPSQEPQPCLANTFSAGGATQCLPCQVGYWTAGQVNQSACTQIGRAHV